jgi:hypothetical protein
VNDVVCLIIGDGRSARICGDFGSIQPVCVRFCAVLNHFEKANVQIGIFFPHHIYNVKIFGDVAVLFCGTAGPKCSGTAGPKCPKLLPCSR